MTGLVRAAEAQTMLASIRSADDAIHVMGVASAAAKWAKNVRRNLAEANLAKTVELQAMIRLARYVNEGQANGTINTAGGIVPVGTMKLSDLGISRKIVQMARELAAAYHDDQSIQDLADSLSDDAELTRGLALTRARRSDASADQWYTPPWLFEQLGLTFDVDVCAPIDEGMRTCPANTYWTEADDGLAQEWKGLIWCNPPYSDPEPWADRMAEHGDGILLTHMPNNAGWMVRAQHAASSVRLIQSMHFVRPSGDLQRPGYSLMLATFGGHLRDALADVRGEKVGPLWT